MAWKKGIMLDGTARKVYRIKKKKKDRVRESNVRFRKPLVRRKHRWQKVA
jgi:hypothetical protein